MKNEPPRPPLDGYNMSPHMAALGARLAESDDGFARLELPFAQSLVGDVERRILHGGVLTALLDNAGGAAVSSTLAKGVAIATLDLRIDYMRPATTGEDLVAEATCFRKTRNVAFVRGVAYHRTPDDLVAAMTATFMIASNQTRELAADAPASNA